MIRFRVKELAQERDLTSEDLARLSGLKISTIRNLYQNAHGSEGPSIKTLSAVAKALGVRIEEMIESDGASSRANLDLDNSNRSAVKSGDTQTPSLVAA